MDPKDIRYYFSTDDLWGLLKFLAIPIGLVATVLALWALGELNEYRANPTYEKLQRLVEAELPSGADKSTVVSFLDRNEIGHGDYHVIPAMEKQLSSEFEDEKLKSDLGRIQHRIYAGRNISNWRWIFGCWATLWFYFDENGKLVTYKMRGLCDG